MNSVDDEWSYEVWVKSRQRPGGSDLFVDDEFGMPDELVGGYEL